MILYWYKIYKYTNLSRSNFGKFLVARFFAIAILSWLVDYRYKNKYILYLFC